MTILADVLGHILGHPPYSVASVLENLNERVFYQSTQHLGRRTILVNLQVVVRRQYGERRFKFLFLATAINLAFRNFAVVVHLQDSPLGDFLPAATSFV